MKKKAHFSLTYFNRTKISFVNEEISQFDFKHCSTEEQRKMFQKKKRRAKFRGKYFIFITEILTLNKSIRAISIKQTFLIIFFFNYDY